MQLTENQLVAIYSSKLQEHFNIYYEIEGYSIISGLKKRIDMVLVSKEKPHGLTKPIMFGVECKKPDLTSLNNYTAWLRQSVGYTQCRWGRNKVQLPILVAPSLDRDYCGKEGEIQSEVMKRVAGAFGIGEIKITEYKKLGKERVSIEMSGSRVWCSFHGFNKAWSKMDFTKKITL